MGQDLCKEDVVMWNKKDGHNKEEVSIGKVISGEEATLLDILEEEEEVAFAFGPILYFLHTRPVTHVIPRIALVEDFICRVRIHLELPLHVLELQSKTSRMVIHIILQMWSLIMKQQQNQIKDNKQWSELAHKIQEREIK